jgi:hypothetical protein
MRSIIALFVFFTALFYSCTAQKNLQLIESSQYQLVSNFTLDTNTNTTRFIKNENDLKEFYSSLKKEYKKSIPRKVVDFTKNQVALVPFDQINTYNIDSISGNEELYQLNLSLIKGIHLNNNQSNVLMIIVPNKIKTITVKNK